MPPRSSRESCKIELRMSCEVNSAQNLSARVGVAIRVAPGPPINKKTMHITEKNYKTYRRAFGMLGESAKDELPPTCQATGQGARALADFLEHVEAARDLQGDGRQRAGY